MRLNKRFILKAPKRGPDELRAELAKLRVLKSSPKYIIRQFAKTVSTVMTYIKSAISQACGCVAQILKSFADAVRNYSMYKKEDEMLFSSVPSIRRFEKDMV